MAQLIHRTPDTNRVSLRPYLPLVAIVVMFSVAVLIAPGDIAAKATLLLHGVCAQRASHSLVLGTSPLPLDARMTGVYLGALTTSLWILAQGRGRAGRVPPRRVLLVLALFVAIMAMDGMNALLGDLHIAQLYPATNGVRLGTGLLAGIALGVGGSHLLATAVGRQPGAVVTRTAELAWLMVLSIAVAGPALSGLGIFYGPYAIGLLLAVVTVFWQFTAALLGMLFPADRKGCANRDFALVATASLCLVLLIMLMTSALRTWAELALILPKLT